MQSLTNTVSEKITLGFRHAGHSTINHYTELHFLMRISKKNNRHKDHIQNQIINNRERWQCQQQRVAAWDLCSAGIMTTQATDLSSVTSVCIMSKAATNLYCQNCWYHVNSSNRSQLCHKCWYHVSSSHSSLLCHKYRYHVNSSYRSPLCHKCQYHVNSSYRSLLCHKC